MRLEKKHPLAIRWFHWISFPLLFLMIWSGLMIYWANPVYFVPQRLLNWLSLDQQLPDGMALHFFFMWFFGVNGILYVSYLALSGEWRCLIPERHAARDAIFVTLYDLRLRKVLPPQGKYNAAQRIAYTSIVLMGAGSLITGLAIYKPTQLWWLTMLLGGYENARFEHFWLMIGFVLFFAVHVAQVIKAGWNNFRSMVAGYELTSTEEE